MEAGNWHPIGNVKGRDGVGVPQGGARGDVLQKTGGSDFAAAWGPVSYEDIVGKVPASALPQISNEPYVVSSQAAMLNLPAVPGRMAIRTDVGKTYVLSQLPASTLANWVELTTSSDVNSVNGKTGNVTLTKADVGLSNVSNTADADKPLATTSVRGLMDPADKTKLNNMTSAATASRGVMRDANARSNFRQVVLSDAPTANNHAATRAYVDDEVNRMVAGRTPISGSTTATNWDALTNTSVAAVVEGFPKGAPAGWNVLVLGQRTASDGFVVSPVWEFKHEALGLDYRKQTAKLLSCDPDYMIGFTWERYYHPEKSRWSSWTCVAGDTGAINSSPASSTQTRGTVFRHRGNEYLYSTSSPHSIRRTVNTIYLSGAATTAAQADLSEIQSNNGLQLGWFTPSREWPITAIWLADDGEGYSTHRIHNGSSKNRWMSRFEGGRILLATRYGPDSPTSLNTWLPFGLSWAAPQIYTWGGPWVAGDGA